MKRLAKWVIPQIEKLPSDIVALNFNLYEEKIKFCFAVQLVGCITYDENDEDWACDIYYSSHENLYYFCAKNWEYALEKFLKLIREELDGTIVLPERIKYVTAGFVDGNLEVIINKRI